VAHPSSSLLVFARGGLRPSGRPKIILDAQCRVSTNPRAPILFRWLISARIAARLSFFVAFPLSQKLRQLRHIGRDPPRFRERLGR